MAKIDRLPETTRYLRFPLARDHRAPLQDGSACPYCAKKRVQKWGRFSGRQRYRCRDCRRTFSMFTGTALRHLKRPDLWRRFLWCVDGRLTVRASAAVLGLDKNTALRWRHRLLEQWRGDPRERLSGCITVGAFTVPRSEPGSRSLTRPARRRGERWSTPLFQTDPETVLVGLEDPATPERMRRLTVHHIGPVHPLAVRYEEYITPRVDSVSVVVGCRGPLSPLGLYARRLGVAYRTDRATFLPRRVFMLRQELRGWLRPFRGVATHRLNNYLEWFRRRGRGSRGPPPQQLLQTEP